MTNLYKDFRTGDLFEFVHSYDDRPVQDKEELWSTTMKRYVRIDGTILFVCQDEHVIFMLTKDGFINTHVYDTNILYYEVTVNGIHPRLIKGQELDR